MMKRLAVLLFALLTASAALADFSGSWTMTTEKENPDRVYLNMTRGRHNNNGSTMDVSAFTGLTKAQINAAEQTPAKFRIDREAGLIAFEGVFKNGNGAGQFTFTSKPEYVRAITSLGLKFDEREGDDEQLFAMTLFDVSTAFIRQMRAEGYNVDLDDYVAMRIFKVTPQYIHAMADLGFGKLDADNLVAGRIHKVTPEYVKQMRAIGYDLPLDDYMAMRIHKATPEFINEIASLGYRNVSADDLVAMRIHKVTPEFIRDLQAHGYRNVPIEKMIEMRIMKIDAKFLDAMSKRQ